MSLPAIKDIINVNVCECWVVCALILTKCYNLAIKSEVEEQKEEVPKPFVFFVFLPPHIFLFFIFFLIHMCLLCCTKNTFLTVSKKANLNYEYWQTGR